MNMIAFPEMPQYAATARHVYWEPVLGSGERITAAVAVSGANGEHRVFNLLSPEVLSILYRSQGDNAMGLVGLITDSLKSHMKRAAGDLRDWVPPLSGFFAAPPKQYVGKDAADVLDQVAGLHSSLYKVKAPAKPARLPSHSDDDIQRRVRDAVRQRIGMKADRIFTPEGIIEVKEGSRIHHLDIPIKTETKVGSIISAWYTTPHIIENHFLRAQSNLAVASEREKYQPGLFISLPSGLEGHKNQHQIEDLVDDIYWRLRRIGYFLEVRESAEALADEVIAWAA